MARYIVLVETLSNNHEMQGVFQDKKDATSFANYYRRKNTAKVKKYKVKMSSI